MKSGEQAMAGDGKRVESEVQTGAASSRGVGLCIAVKHVKIQGSSLYKFLEKSQERRRGITGGWMERSNVTDKIRNFIVTSPHPFLATSTFGRLCSPSHEVSISLRRNTTLEQAYRAVYQNVSAISGLGTMDKSCMSKYAQTESPKYKDHFLVDSPHTRPLMTLKSEQQVLYANRIPATF